MNDISLYEKIPALENSFPVKIRRMTRSTYPLMPHWHEHIEILMFTKGACDVTISGSTVSVGAGDLVAVNSNLVHSFVVSEASDYFYILLYPQFFSDVDFSNIRLQSLVRGDAVARGLIMDMYSEYTRNDAGGDMQIKALAYHLMVHLMRTYPITRITRHEYHAQVSSLERLNRVLEYISAHFHERISTEELAAMCFFSESHFCRFFKSAIGKSPISYINTLRCEKAAVMLKNTDESISKIAEFVSFDDANYFSRVFRKVKGCSPAQFRLHEQ